MNDVGDATARPEGLTWLDPDRPGRQVDLCGSRLRSGEQLVNLMAFLHPWDDETDLKFSLEASTGSAVSVSKSRLAGGGERYVVRPLGHPADSAGLLKGYLRMREKFGAQHTR